MLQPHFNGNYEDIYTGTKITLEWDAERDAYIETSRYVIAGEERESRVAITPAHAGYMIATGWKDAD